MVEALQNISLPGEPANEAPDVQPPGASDSPDENEPPCVNGSLARQIEEPFLRNSLDTATKLLKTDSKIKPAETAELSEVLMAEMQEENLGLHDALRDLEVRCREAEENASRRSSQVEELQKRLMSMEEEASAARSAATESLRLTDENTLLGNQLRLMEINLKDLIDTQGLGHTNSKQPIQYHLRLKNELEELRSESVCLLKEKFQLEQCVRYLAATTMTPSYHTTNGSASMRSSTPKFAAQPQSLQQNRLYLTPSSRTSMLKSGRGVAASMNRTPTPTKEALMDSIHLAASKTASSFQELAADVEQQADTAATPLRRRQSRGGASEESDSLFSEERLTPSEDGASAYGPNHGLNHTLLAGGGQSAVERRIMAKIADICSPGKTGASSRLLQQAQGDENKDVSKTNLAPKLRRSHSKSLSSVSGKSNAKVIWK